MNSNLHVRVDNYRLEIKPIQLADRVQIKTLLDVIKVKGDESLGFTVICLLLKKSLSSIEVDGSSEILKTDSEFSDEQIFALVEMNKSTLNKISQIIYQTMWGICPPFKDENEVPLPGVQILSPRRHSSNWN